MEGTLAIAEAKKLQSQTAAHYDAHPFEFLTPEDELSIRKMQPAPFAHFVDTYARQGLRIAEIGCGPGRATLFLARQGREVVAVDISHQSLLLARQRTPSAAFVRSTNLKLPFDGSQFDIVVSDGVIHHTPNARTSFSENARILKGGGYLYLGVYNRRRYYYYFYTFVGGPIRLLAAGPIGRGVLHATLIPVYWAVHLVKSKGKRTWQGAVNFFYDYFITPRATFHTFEEVCEWGREERLDLVGYDRSLGNVHVFIFKKENCVDTRTFDAEASGCL